MKTGNKYITFIRAYIKSMRLYYSFITGISGLIGLSFYQYLAYSGDDKTFFGFNHTIETPTPLPKLLLILIILFLSWGINQIYNDYLGLKEDRINAPDRPMVSGELNPLAAVFVSTMLMIIAFCLTWFFLETEAIIPLIIGVGLNILYEYAKGYGLWGNIIFGFMISTCSMYGFLASGKSDISLFSLSQILLIVYIALINGLMTFYTYFKDYEGDKAVGKKTIIVRMGLVKSQKLSIIASFLPLAVFLIFYYGIGAWHFELNGIFLVLGLLATGLQIWTGYLYFINPKGEMTYFSLAMNFRACTCSESALISVFNPALGVVLFLMSYFFIGFLFNFHVNRKG
ncbi:MAG: ubiquinone biosynthesis protein UbiA [Ignavibacteria bacterium GWB2_35_12]|nr:MAG: ubiquinone biosynthesis protein UbiA [Ignavibacteria bacterium GWA2_35_8]OGU38023.1 MAG: ubiquinone biosynthesis protein UbiA [Ignavibacteria bacterium GWB2_35_12]OGU89105.1 MAG: ubiquinone biosynthesis protein UbiA [Ignavibacteria bacterium RIFOXYA2_FULL_35_10]OGV25055.1 MAG: ubiquinone biosynthesis protein UbiA [Ignavibacteria bacterium RIFOXYC2_FULL_35_21]